MATPIPLCQPTQYPSMLALAAIPSFHRLVHHMCVHHTPSHRPLSTFMGMCTPNFNNHLNSASTQCLWATTIHPPLVFPPLHHQSVVADTTHVICLLHCGLGCPLCCGWVGVLVVLGDGLGESWLCGR